MAGMSEAEVLDLLQDVGAFRSGHFVYTSGRHGDAYINKDALFMHPHETFKLAGAIAENFKDDNIEAVIAPAVAGAILAQWTAYQLSEMTDREVCALYADKADGGLVIKRGYDKAIQGKRTLVVEDLLTTGGSLKKVVDAARAAGANIIGAAALANRGGVTKEQVGNPEKFVTLVNIHLESWDAAACELCQNNIPVNTDVGHGKEFLEHKK